MIYVDPEFSQLLPHGQEPFTWLMDMDGDAVREMDGRRTVPFSLGGRQFWIKAHTGVGWGEIFKNLAQLRMPVLGAGNEWRGIAHLRGIGVDTMQAVAWGRRGINPARLRSFVVTRDLGNAESLEDFCARCCAAQGEDARRWLGDKRVLIRRVARIARRMHASGANHRDLYLCHILLERPSGRAADDLDSARLFVIDLHRMQLRRRTPFRWAVKDVAALYFSSMDLGLTRRDRLRFMRAYRDVPLRQTLREDTRFWNAVRARALHLQRNRRVG